MVVRYACMGCPDGPRYFTSFQAASVHYARSSICNQSERSIAATVVLPNRPTDQEAGGCGAQAAGSWAGPPRNARYRPRISEARPGQRRSSAGMNSSASNFIA